MTDVAAAIRLADVRFGYGRQFDLHIASLRIEAGERVALLGPNGSGKTTLLRLIAGVRRPRTGGVHLLGRPLHGQSRQVIARQLAVVAQNAPVPFAFTAREIVTLGRTAYSHPLTNESAADRDAVEHSLEAAQLTGLANRRYDQLSGGEQQRVLLAMALAQAPRVLLLDEPTSHLDIAYQVQMLDVVAHLNQTRGVTVVAALHDLNLAALYFPRLILMLAGRVVADGAPGDVLNVSRIREVYGADMLVQTHPERDVPQVLAQPRHSA